MATKEELRAKAWKEYRNKDISANKEYLKKEGSAWKKYLKIKYTAWAKYLQIEKTARKKYNKRCAEIDKMHIPDAYPR